MGRVASGLPDTEDRRSWAKAKRAQATYLELSIDLIERGERIAPGSSRWIDCLVWSIAQPRLPRLETLRFALLAAKGRLGLCTPSPEERATTGGGSPASADPVENGWVKTEIC